MNERTTRPTISRFSTLPAQSRNMPQWQAGNPERKFSQWRELAGGGRCYWLDVPGHHGWLARYLKEVDVDENTIRFWQEIYDDSGKLVEVDEKFPVDRGHQRL